MDLSLNEACAENNYERFLKGDTKAFEDIVVSYRKGLILFINRYVNNLDTAEDIAEDVFVRLLIKKPKYKGDASFKTWLFSMGRNLSIDYLRKSGKTFPCENVYNSEAADAEEEFLTYEKKRMVYKALDTLCQDEKLLLHLLYIENLGYEQAEKILKAPKSKLYQIARKAKEKLKTELIKEDIL